MRAKGHRKMSKEQRETMVGREREKIESGQKGTE